MSVRAGEGARRVPDGPVPPDSAELMDEDLEVVVGGLWRAWSASADGARVVERSASAFDAFDRALGGDAPVR